MDTKISQMINGVTNLIVISISRDETENMNFTRINNLFDLLHEKGVKGHNKVQLSFEYDDDPREIYEIDDIVMFILQLYKKYKNLFYFLHTDNYQGLVFLYCLAGVKVISKNTENTQVALTDPDMAAAIRNTIISETRAYGKSINDIQGAEYSLRNIFP